MMKMYIRKSLKLRKCKLSCETVKDCLENSLYSYVHEKTQQGKTAYRMQRMYMKLVPLLTMLINV